MASAGSTGEAPSMAALLAPHDSPGPTSATLRDRIRDLLEQPDSTVTARVVNYVLMFTILVSTASVALETMPEFRGDLAFFILEMVITAFFTVEFLLRFYACESVRTFALNGLNLIDFFAIFPGYMELMSMLAYETRSWFGSADSETLVHKAASSMRTLRVVRMGRLLRLIRVMRLAKAARHTPSLGIVMAVITRVSTTALAVTFMLLGVATVLSASFAYISESELCDNKASGCSGAFDSIPAAFWWAVATLTTVGYGDMIPRTTVGKVISGLTAVIGVVVVAIGVALVSRNFSECYIEEKARAEVRGLLVAQSPRSRRQEVVELHKQREVFEQKSAALVLKLRSMAMQREADSMVHLKPMLDMIAFHSTQFSSDVQLYANTFLSKDAAPSSVRSSIVPLE